MLDVALRKRLGRFHLDIALRAKRGSTLVVVGESGSGKTTLLRLLAGLEMPDAGRIAVNEDVWFDGTSASHLPPWKRSVGFVPHDLALFPHLSVADNVGFGLQAEGRRASETTPRVEAVLASLGISAYIDARPSQLSGGQQQRVALARALVLEPQLLLLDEPLSALDLGTRQLIRSELQRILRARDCITVYVTHAPSEALVLGDEIAVLEDGRLTQSGDRTDFLRSPRSAYVAAFLGINLVKGEVIEAGDDGTFRVATGWGALSATCAAGAAVDGDVVVIVNPSAVALHRDRPDADSNLVHGEIVEVMPQPPDGERVRVRLATEPLLLAEIDREELAQLGVEEGNMVWASFAVDDAYCHLNAVT